MHPATQFLLRPDMTFLNHGSFGACPAPVFATYQAWQRELEAQPVDLLWRRLPGLLADARARLAAYLNAQPDDLVFVPNATHGINIIARALHLAPGDEVLTTNHEYGAADRTWRFICGQRGARYINQPVALPLTSAAAVVDQLWAAVNQHTRVMFISHITSPTALTFPVAEICQRARAAGILTVIDGAHAPGQIELDLTAIGADYYTGNCHKWLLAPKGAGFLHARPEVQPLLEPLIVSWGYQPEVPGISGFQDLFGWTGTADPAAYLSVPAAIDFLAQHTWPAVRANCHSLLQAASDQIAALTGQPQLSPDTNEFWVQMRAFRLPPCDAAVLKTRLWEEFQVEVPITVWHGQPLLRVSVQAYNTREDTDRLLAGLQRLL